MSDRVDIGSIDGSPHDRARKAPNRRWLGVRFDCCQVYNRIYRNKAGTQYRGRCPKCYREVTVRVGSDGVSSRFFKAT